MARHMKQSGVDWLGDIPADWSLAQLKRFVHVNNGREVPTEINQCEDAVPVYGSGGIFKYTDTFLYDGEAVMFGRKGTLGKPIYVNKKFWTVDTMYYLTFSDELFAKFNYYQLVAFDWEPHITQTALPSIVASEIISCKFAVPPIDEQECIAAYLDDKCGRIDSVISKTRATIDEYKKLKQAIITRAVTRGIRANRTLKHSGIDWLGDIPAHWTVCRIKNLANVFTGNSIKDEHKKFYEDPVEAIPYVSTKDIDVTLQTINFFNGMYVKLSDKSFKRAPSHSILLCIEGGSAGKKIAYTEREICFVNKLCCFHSSTCCNKYLYYQLMSSAFTEPFNSHIAGLIGGVSVKALNNFKVLCPPIDEQREIAAYLDEKTAAIDSVVAKKISSSRSWNA